jgi:alkaline phosphatase D
MKVGTFLGALAALVVLGLALARSTAEHAPAQVKSPPPPPVAASPIHALTRIAVGSGADQHLPEPIWDEVLAARPDLFIFMGDTVYGDVSGKDPALPELAEAYRTLGKNRGFVRLREEVPILAIWDDHDYGMNDADRTFPFKAQSKALFMSFWNIPLTAPRAKRPGLYNSVILGPPGSRVQIILLDLRWFRDPFKPMSQRDATGKEMYVPDLDPIRTMLGPAQWSWLEAELEKPAELRLIVSPIQVLAEGHGYEKWGNFPRERQRLFDLIARTKANGIVFLSGDRHVGALYRQADGVPYPLFEMTSSALNRPADNITDEPTDDRLGGFFNQANFGLVLIDWARQTVRLELHDVEGRPVEPTASVPLAALKVSTEMAAPAIDTVVPGG